MSIADVYSVIGTQIMPEFIMKSDCNITQNQRHYFSLTALLNAGEEYANNKDYNNALAYYTTNLVFYSKN
jgi:hypothetical protein